jgi:hypothetical protein
MVTSFEVYSSLGISGFFGMSFVIEAKVSAGMSALKQQQALTFIVQTSSSI